ncbi:PIN domain nuclease [Candidatus Nanohalobium constans]|uniref:PIN domain nuclease n=2 Tax=Candidatus Nanohalobium constans TaxID=2565781 RepID=A0A5Q0UFG5_9ARCH|nr:PIN domain nuclease [Candidatus Nanohalobium constans]
MEKASSITTGSTVLYELSKISDFNRKELEQNKIFDLTSEDGEVAAEMYRKLSRKGEKIGEIDYLIAAQAKNAGRKLVTRDTDFQKLEIDTINYKL